VFPFLSCYSLFFFVYFPLFFLSFFVFTYVSLVFLSFLIFFVFFFSLLIEMLFPFHFFFFFFPGPPLVFIRGRGGEGHPTLSNHVAGVTGATLPLSNHRDRVTWLERPLCSRSQGMTLLFFFNMVVGHEREWVVSGFGQIGREALQGRKTSSSPVCVRSGEEEDAQCNSKWHHFVLLFLWTAHEIATFWTKHAVSFKRKWRQKCRLPNQSLIFYLSNQVLNYNFDFKNQFNYIPAKLKWQPWSWLPFSLWYLVLNLCIFILNWTINFQFLQFSSLFCQFQSLYLRVFSSLVLSFGFLQPSP